MMPSGIAMGILNPVAGKMYDRIAGRSPYWASRS